MKHAFFKNSRVYVLAGVAYMGSFLFGTYWFQRRFDLVLLEN